MTLEASLNLSTQYSQTVPAGSSGPAGPGVEKDSLTFTKRWTDGTTTGLSNMGVSAKNDALVGIETIDLRAFPTTRSDDALLVEVTEMVFVNTGDEDLTISPGASDGWDASPIKDVETVPPGGMIAFVNPADPAYATDATHKTLDIECPSGTGAYELHVRGRLA